MLMFKLIVTPIINNTPHMKKVLTITNKSA